MKKPHLFHDCYETVYGKIQFRFVFFVLGGKILFPLIIKGEPLVMRRLEAEKNGNMLSKRHTKEAVSCATTATVPFTIAAEKRKQNK